MNAESHVWQKLLIMLGQNGINRNGNISFGNQTLHFCNILSPKFKLYLTFLLLCLTFFGAFYCLLQLEHFVSKGGFVRIFLKARRHSSAFEQATASGGRAELILSFAVPPGETYRTSQPLYQSCVNCCFALNNLQLVG